VSRLLLIEPKLHASDHRNRNEIQVGAITYFPVSLSEIDG
jgi:hypothetical protein